MILLNDDVCHLGCIDMSLQEDLYPNITDIGVRPRFGPSREI